MSQKLDFSRVLRMAACMCMAGTLFASSCSTQDLRTVMSAVDAAARILDGGEPDDADISFGDWLRDEWDDL